MEAARGRARREVSGEPASRDSLRDMELCSLDPWELGRDPWDSSLLAAAKCNFLVRRHEPQNPTFILDALQDCEWRSWADCPPEGAGGGGRHFSVGDRESRARPPPLQERRGPALWGRKEGCQPRAGAEDALKTHQPLCSLLAVGSASQAGSYTPCLLFVSLSGTWGR